MEISKGDIVRYLNSQGGGEVTGFLPDGKVLVMDSAVGMEIPVERRECVVVSGMPGMAKGMKMHYTGGVGVKKAQDSKPVVRPKESRVESQVVTGCIEVDLHLKDGMPGNALNIQLERCRRALNEHRKSKGLKIVFIHGKGDGSLRLQLMKLLMTEFPSFIVGDASFSKYGMYGATEVTVR